MVTIPKCMSTQHPDNVETPPYSVDGVLKGDGEVQEAAEVFSLGADEQMWDSEGKDVDRMVVHKLLSGYPDFFHERRLGKDCFVTLRVPNPAVELAMRKTLVETLESIPSSWDAAQEFYGNGNFAPIQEVILPLTTSAEELNRIYYYYTNHVVGKEEHPLYGRQRVSDWIGQVNPRRINVIPLIEDRSHLVTADTIVEEYLRDKELPYQRVFLARSDPALNYGVVTAELALKTALQRLAGLQERLGTPLYCIVGAGSAPFRGHLTPLNLHRAFREYPSTHTFTIQSAFKYDYDREKVASAIATIRGHVASAPIPVEEERAGRIMDRYTAEYQRCLRSLVGLINALAGMQPHRRERKLHIGLFGYSRSLEAENGGQGAIRLPRAIEFCASLYSVGIPPELLGMDALTHADLSYLKEVYPSLAEDLAAAVRFANAEAINHALGPRYAALAARYAQDVDMVHQGLTSAVRASLDSRPESYTRRYVVEAARLRHFLG